MYTFTRLPFGVAPAGDIFWGKFNEIFKGLPNAFDIADDILLLGYHVDSRDHDRPQILVIKYAIKKTKR